MFSFHSFFGSLRGGAIAAVSASVALILAVSSPLSAHEYKVGALIIDHPWSRATPKGAKVAGGFFIIRNNDGQNADRLVSISSDISGKPEIHEMTVQDNVMRMRALDSGLPIPASSEIALKPGSYHVMFMDLKRPLKEGESFKAILNFERAGAVEVSFTVEAMGGEKMQPGHDMPKGH